MHGTNRFSFQLHANDVHAQVWTSFACKHMPTYFDVTEPFHNFPYKCKLYVTTENNYMNM